MFKGSDSTNGSGIPSEVAPERSSAPGGFTLIEIMIVVGIIGIIVTMGVPMIYGALKREPFTRAINDILEVCSTARADAILKGRRVEVAFHGASGRIEILGGGASARPGDSPAPRSSSRTSGPKRSAQLDERVAIEWIGLSYKDYMDEEEVRARFYPNGTCDELMIILRSDQGEQRKIWYEVTTGQANVGRVGW